jgi:methyl-accepting chemotaxis protein
LKRTGIAGKIGLGFASVLALLVVVAGAGYLALNEAADGFEQYRDFARESNLAGKLQADMLMVRMSMKDYLLTGSQEDLQQYNDYLSDAQGFLAQADESVTDETRQAIVARIAEGIDSYAQGFDRLIDEQKTREAAYSVVVESGDILLRSLNAAINEAGEQDNETLGLRAHAALNDLMKARFHGMKFIDEERPESRQAFNSELDQLAASYAQLLEAAEASAVAPQLQAAADAIPRYRQQLNAVSDSIERRTSLVNAKMDVIGPQIAADAEEIKTLVMAQQDELGPKLEASLKRAVNTIGFVSLGALILGAVLALLIAKGITRPVRQVIESLTRGADEVTSASEQVAESSSQMAEGASEQASSLEETSASLEEMSAMTQQNAENTHQANQMAQQARDAAEEGRRAMTQMSTTITGIKNSSDETSKIIHTIDEIAFQTNLLALNAAVEAARAGDAGKGFAVVAEEVRNLAQRSAEAARNTSSLIEESRVHAEEGVAATEQMEATLGKIAEHVERVTQLIAEVSAASAEQSQGITQVNTAVSEMDRVTQANAANSEEAASASEELSAQAQDLNDLVQVLVSIVGGSAADQPQQHSVSKAATAGRVKTHGSHPGRSTGAVHPTAHRNGTNGAAGRRELATAGVKKQREVLDPEQVIPLDDEDLKDF